MVNNGLLNDIPNYLRKEITDNRILAFEKLISVPCGMCSECVRSRALNWSFRLVNEAKYHSNNYCITFTYDDDNLPLNGSLVKDEISRFNKKLKMYLKRNGYDSTFRFFGCGEYGDKYKRPHYHVIYFGLPLFDLVFTCVKNGVIYFDSPFIRHVWNKGHISISEFSERAATYVSSYVNKKIGKLHIDDNTIPPFTIMSRNPGIGSQVLADKKFLDKIDSKDYKFFENGFAFNLSRYYIDKLGLDLSSDYINPIHYDLDMSIEKYNEQLFFDDLKNNTKYRDNF